MNACWYDIDPNSKDSNKAVFRLVIDVSGVTGADTSSGFGSVYFSTGGPANPGDIKVGDLTFDAAHKHGGGTPVTLTGVFFVKKTP